MVASLVEHSLGLEDKLVVEAFLEVGSPSVVASLDSPLVVELLQEEASPWVAFVSNQQVGSHSLLLLEVPQQGPSHSRLVAEDILVGDNL